MEPFTVEVARSEVAGDTELRRFGIEDVDWSLGATRFVELGVDEAGLLPEAGAERRPVGRPAERVRAREGWLGTSPSSSGKARSWRFSTLLLTGTVLCLPSQVLGASVPR